MSIEGNPRPSEPHDLVRCIHWSHIVFNLKSGMIQSQVYTFLFVHSEYYEKV